MPPEPVEPAVFVEPFVLEAESAAGGQGTGEVLTKLFIQKLRSSGVAIAGKEESPYLFRAAVPELGYSSRGGYPRKITYFSRLTYQLVHRDTGTVVWNGNAGQDFEQTVLVNTMTKLPSDPGAPERVLLEKCVEPTWSSVASDVGEYLKGRSEP